MGVFRFSLAILACVALPCRAAELGPPATMFTSAEGVFDGAYVSTGVDWALGTAGGQRGLAVRLTAGSGVSFFRADPREPFRLMEVKQAARLFAGWRETGSWGVATVFAGLAVEQRALIPALPDPQTGYRVGPAIAVDAWLKPADRIALQVYAEAALPYNALSFRLAPGYDIGDGVFVGPEMAVGLHHGTMRSRAGLHVTGLQMFGVGLRLSAGYAQDRGGRGGPYAGFALWRSY